MVAWEQEAGTQYDEAGGSLIGYVSSSFLELDSRSRFRIKTAVFSTLFSSATTMIVLPLRTVLVGPSILEIGVF